MYSSFFFFNDTATTEIYTLSLHDALPIYSTFLRSPNFSTHSFAMIQVEVEARRSRNQAFGSRSEEHTSELQSHLNLVCRLLLEKKKRHLTSNRLVCPTFWIVTQNSPYSTY